MLLHEPVLPESDVRLSVRPFVTLMYADHISGAIWNFITAVIS